MIRVIFITQKKDVHSSIILEELLGSKYIEIVGVITSKTQVHKKNLIGSVFYIYIKSGFLYLSMRVWEAIYLKFYNFLKMLGWDKFKGEKTVSVADLIKEHGLYHFETENINNKHSLNIISQLKADVMVSCIFNQIYGKKLMGMAPKGIINIHRAYLPAYGGVSPTFWALANNEKETGITAHLVTPEIDKGPVLLQRKISISKDETVHTLSKKLMESIKKDFVNDLIKYTNNEMELKKIYAKGSYYSWPSRKAVFRFLKNRRKLI